MDERPYYVLLGDRQYDALISILPVDHPARIMRAVNAWLADNWSKWRND